MSGLPRTVKRIRGTGWDAWALPSGMKGKWMKKIGLKKNDLVLTLILLPGLVYFIINNYMPMAGIFMAFKKVYEQQILAVINLFKSMAVIVLNGLIC